VQAARNYPSKERNTVVERGLVLVRYARAVDVDNPPVVEIIASGPTPRGFSIISAPGARPGILDYPGDCLVIHAPARTDICVRVHAQGPRGSLDATVELEPLGSQSAQQSAQPTQRAAAPEPPQPVLRAQGSRALTSRAAQPVRPHPPLAGQGREGASQPAEISVLAHVARRGDVWVGAGEWIAGPNAPARIEGFAIEWPHMPAGLTLQYGVTVGSRTGRVIDRDPAEAMREAGTFVGTRGQALPLLALALELGGRDAARYTLAVQAMFHGSPAVRRQGREIRLAGPTGREPLIGFSIAIQPASEAAPPAKSTASGKTQRVRVFRGAKSQ
jgi:hypothetical protein